MNTTKFYDDLFKLAQMGKGINEDLAEALELWGSGNYWEAIAKLQQANRDATRLDAAVQVAQDRIELVLGSM